MPIVQKLSTVQIYNAVISLKLIHLNFVVCPLTCAGPVVLPPGTLDSGPHYLTRQVWCSITYPHDKLEAARVIISYHSNRPVTWEI